MNEIKDVAREDRCPGISYTDILRRHVTAYRPFPLAWYTDSCCLGEQCSLQKALQSVRRDMTRRQQEALYRPTAALLDVLHLLDRYQQAMRATPLRGVMIKEISDAICGPVDRETMQHGRFDDGHVILARVENVLRTYRPEQYSYVPKAVRTMRAKRNAAAISSSPSESLPLSSASPWSVHLEDCHAANKKHILHCLRLPDGVPHVTRDRFGAPVLTRGTGRIENFWQQLQRVMPRRPGPQTADRFVRLWLGDWNMARLAQFDSTLPYLSFDSAAVAIWWMKLPAVVSVYGDRPGPGHPFRKISHFLLAGCVTSSASTGRRVHESTSTLWLSTA